MSFLRKDETALWVVDVQTKLFPSIDRKDAVLEKICLFLKAAQIFKLPLVVTEQYPKGLGHTLPNILSLLPENQSIWEKTAFSGYFDEEIKSHVNALACRNWILIGVETHICMLQTAKDLIAANRNVVILNDATTARSFHDYSTGIEELKGIGARISNSETVIYELIRDAKAPEFKEILNLIKCHD